MRMGYGSPTLIGACVSIFILLVLPTCLADFDVNAIEGFVTIRGSPAPPGTVVKISRGDIIYDVSVDGENVPPFQHNKGYFNTGDISWVSTGDSIYISIEGYEGSVTISSLGAGTTFVDIVIGGELTVHDAKSSIGLSGNEIGSDSFDDYQGQAALISIRRGNRSNESLTESAFGIFESFIVGAEQTSLDFLTELEITFISISERMGSLLNTGFRKVRSIGRATILLGKYLGGSSLIQTMAMSVILVSGLVFLIMRRRIITSGNIISRVDEESGSEIESSPFWDSRSLGKY